MESFFNYNVVIDVVGIVIIILIVASGLRFDMRDIYTQLFTAMSGTVLLVFLTDIPAWALNGVVFAGSRLLCFGLDSVYYSSQIVFCYFLFLFTVYWNRRSYEDIRRMAVPALSPLAAEIVMILLNPWTGWVFTISPQNVYARGSLYLVNLIPYILYVGGSIAVSVGTFLRSKDVMERRQSSQLLLFMILPIFAMFLDSAHYGVSCLWPCVALLLLMIYQHTQQQMMSEERMKRAREEERAAQLSARLMEARVSVMLSQIQLHFLYNALGAIQALCRKDSALAEQTVVEFAEYLRGNMDSLTADKPIPFEQELAHTKHYLALEQIRFGECLTIRYDLHAMLFRLPALTLQPIVENAVRYGVTKREAGGTIVISAEEQADAFVVTVRDDGVGYDPEMPHQDGRTHIGIQNVRGRLEAMCGGTLEIASVPDVGTTAVITLPKKE